MGRSSAMFPGPAHRETEAPSRESINEILRAQSSKPKETLAEPMMEDRLPFRRLLAAVEAFSYPMSPCGSAAAARGLIKLIVALPVALSGVCGKCGWDVND